MEHSEAVGRGSVEKYLLGSLTDDEREQFEEHFFGCRRCAAEVRAGAVFVDSAREIFRGEASPVTEPGRAVWEPRREKRGWTDWFQPAFGAAALAAILLLGVIVYQNLIVLPRMRAELASIDKPQVLTGFSLLRAGSRGGAPSKFKPPKDKPFSIYINVPGKAQYVSYEFALRNKAGVIRFVLPVSAEQAGDTVEIEVPPGELQPGAYDLVIRGKDAHGVETPVADYPLDII